MMIASRSPSKLTGAEGAEDKIGFVTSSATGAKITDAMIAPRGWKQNPVALMQLPTMNTTQITPCLRVGAVRLARFQQIILHVIFVQKERRLRFLMVGPLPVLIVDPTNTASSTRTWQHHSSPPPIIRAPGADQLGGYVLTVHYIQLFPHGNSWTIIAVKTRRVGREVIVTILDL
jgi:hypothetical protein